MPPFYTKTGDDGTTGTLGKDRLPKHHPRIEALGSLDEASAALGLARALSRDPRTAPLLAAAQRDLYALMAEVAAAHENAERFRTLGRERVAWLESRIEALSAEVPAPKEFILPGDSPAGAAVSLARTVVRRAERRVAELLDRGELGNPALMQYLNRLSSLCFILELVENRQAGSETSLAKE